jgi:hypothetical protein
MLSIARFKALSALRRRPEEGLNEETAERIEDQSDDPEVALAKKDKGAVLRQVIDLVYYHKKSAAEVSGIVALMLQREPTLNPDNVRHILLTTAKDSGARRARQLVWRRPCRRLPRDCCGKVAGGADAAARLRAHRRALSEASASIARK